jgi:DNA-binding NarL/FixJ family response regulator
MFQPKPHLLAKKARIMIVDDHPAVREGLAYRICLQPDMVVCGEASTLREATDKALRLAPHLVIVDIALKSDDGLELIRHLAAQAEHIRTLVYSMYEEASYAQRCLRAGARGYVNKGEDASELIEAIRGVLSGQICVSREMTDAMLRRAAGYSPDVDPVDTLTDRQLEVFRLFGEGRNVSQISHELHISVRTVQTHRDNIKRKLQLETIAELNRLAIAWVLRNR